MHGRTPIRAGKRPVVLACTELHPAHRTPCTWAAEHRGQHRDRDGRTWACRCAPGNPCERHGGQR